MKRPLPSLRLTVAAIVGLATAMPASAQFAKPEDAIKYRKSVMTLQFNHFGRIAAMANGKVPFDAKVAAENAEVLATIVRLAPAGFVDGSDKGETKAKPEIWTEMDKFRANASRLREEADKLNAAAKSGSLDAIKAAVGETGKVCKGCHDSYQKE